MRTSTTSGSPQLCTGVGDFAPTLPEPDLVERFLSELADGAPVLRLDTEPEPASDRTWKVAFLADAFAGVDSPEGQQAVFERVAGLLAPAGRFVVHARMPQAWRFTKDTRIVVADVDPERVVLDVARIDRRTESRRA